MRNSSLVESVCAEDLPGLSSVPKLRIDVNLLTEVVEERSVSLRRSIEKLAGGIGSANADMSNDYAGEKPARRMSKGSCATLIGAG